MCRFHFPIGFVLMCVAVAHSNPPEQKSEGLPECVRHIPPDSMLFVQIRVQELLNSETGKLILKEEVLKSEKGKDGYGAILGLKAEEIETLTLLYLPAPPEWDKEANILTLSQMIDPEMFSETFLITTRQSLDRKKILKQLAKDVPAQGSYLFLSDYTILVGSKSNVLRFTDLRQRKNPAVPLKPALDLAAQKKSIVCGLHLSEAMRRMVKLGLQLDAMVAALAQQF